MKLTKEEIEKVERILVKNEINNDLDFLDKLLDEFDQNSSLMILAITFIDKKGFSKEFKKYMNEITIEEAMENYDS